MIQLQLLHHSDRQRPMFSPLFSYVRYNFCQSLPDHEVVFRGAKWKCHLLYVRTLEGFVFCHFPFDFGWKRSSFDDKTPLEGDQSMGVRYMVSSAMFLVEVEFQPSFFSCVLKYCHGVEIEFHVMLQYDCHVAVYSSDFMCFKVLFQGCVNLWVTLFCGSTRWHGGIYGLLNYKLSTILLPLIYE